MFELTTCSTLQVGYICYQENHQDCTSYRTIRYNACHFIFLVCFFPTVSAVQFLMHCVCVCVFFSVELEGLAPNGFGKVMEIKYRRTSTVFFKLPGDLIDGEIGPHSRYLQSAGVDIQRCQENYCYMSKLSDDLRRAGVTFHPQLELK